jgi:predicted regulator of Ras-like GTPase activity (Roadblock/LC7/MglB family)
MALGAAGKREVLASRGVEASQALADLMEISSQVQAAVLLDDAGEPIASKVAHEGRAGELARISRELLAAAEQLRPGADQRRPAQLEVATGEGSVFVVRDGERAIAATTGPSPTVGLVFYDLKTCLRALAAPDEQPNAGGRQRRRPARAAPAESGETA